MQIKLDLNTENLLSVEATRTVVATIRSLEERADAAQAQVAALTGALNAAVARAEAAEAALADLRAVMAQALADLKAGE